MSRKRTPASLPVSVADMVAEASRDMLDRSLMAMTTYIRNQAQAIKERGKERMATQDLTYFLAGMEAAALLLEDMNEQMFDQMVDGQHRGLTG